MLSFMLVTGLGGLKQSTVKWKMDGKLNKSHKLTTIRSLKERSR